MKRHLTKRMYRKNNKGVGLIELVFALGIIAFVTLSIFSFMSTHAENKKADNAGMQFAEVGRALGNYLTREANVLNACLVPGGAEVEIPFSVLTSSSGVTPAGACSLNNRQFLPTNTSQTNLFGVDYRLLVKKSPSGSISGLVISDQPVKDPNTSASDAPKYNWLGRAIRTAGPQAGMTFETTGANSLRGLGGGWELSSADFSAINDLGLMGYRVSFQETNDDIYLRLDGAYPMRGNLNMGNYNINNATDINFNGWLNGNNALLNNIKSGYINNAGSIVTDTLQAQHAVTTGNYHAGSTPTGSTSTPGSAVWNASKSYVHTGNVYSEGMVAVGSNGNVRAYMNQDGLIGASNIYLDNLNHPGQDNVRVRGYLTDRLPTYVNKGTIVVHDNTVVQKDPCVAAGGMSKSRIMVTPQIQNTYGDFNVKVEVRATPDNRIHTTTYRSAYTSDQIRVYAVDEGSSWRVHLKSFIGDARGATQGWQALATVYCDFS